MAAIESVVSEIWTSLFDMAGLECLVKMKIDNIMTQVGHLVFSVGVPVSRPISEFAPLALAALISEHTPRTNVVSSSTNHNRLQISLLRCHIQKVRLR